jgi:hypothetical protein
VSSPARWAAAALLVGAALAGCGDDPGRRVDEPRDAFNDGPIGVRPTSVPAAAGEVFAFATVLDDGDGPELCVGGVLTSLPPQCSGPSLVSWNWDDHAGDFEEARGIRWGGFAVTGTFDGTAISPTRIVPADEYDEPPYESSRDFTSPCPVPAGGWQVLDPARTTERTRSQAIHAASAMEGFAEAWVDQSINPLSDLPDNDPSKEEGMNDPTKLVLNISTAGDVAATEAVVRETWGGALCVSEARFSDKELEPIQEAMSDLPGFAGSSRGQDRVEVWVTYDDGSIQEWADATYGEGAVVVTSSLRDVES